MKKFVFMAFIAVLGISNLNGAGAGAVAGETIDEISADGTKLRVNGADYLALVKPCKGWQKGDRVQILRGAKNGHCLVSVMINERTNTKCDLLCDAR